MTDGQTTFEFKLSGQVDLMAQYADEVLRRTINNKVKRVLTYGVDESEFNIPVKQIRPLQAAGTETLNLYDGSLYDMHRQAAAFRVLRWCVIWIESGGDTSGLTIEGGASNPHLLGMGGTTPTFTIYPSGLPFCSGGPGGMAVTSSVKNVKLTNNGAALLNYGIMLLGSNRTNPAAGTWMVPGVALHV